jgi:hypothetical protein
MTGDADDLLPASSGNEPLNEKAAELAAYFEHEGQSPRVEAEREDSLLNGGR